MLLKYFYQAEQKEPIMTNIPQVRLSVPYKKVSKIINGTNDASETWSQKNETKRKTQSSYKYKKDHLQSQMRQRSIDKSFLTSLN